MGSQRAIDDLPRTNRTAIKIPPVIGHRGAARLAPENTIAALEAAAADGAEWVEFDVKLTRDGVPVIMHDPSIKRTTGVKAKVKHIDYDDLARLDAGRWFDPAFTGERVPTLRDALKTCARLGLAPNIEIKPCRGLARRTAVAVAETVAAYWPDRVGVRRMPVPLVSSFNPISLVAIRKAAPHLPRGWLVNRPPRGWEALAHRLDIVTLHANGLHISAKLVQSCAALGMPLIAWTINNPHLAKSLTRSGVASLITDAPGDIMDAITEPGSHMPALYQAADALTGYFSRGGASAHLT